jgi:glycosyltransferase involved in cell wall biosynthesis
VIWYYDQMDTVMVPSKSTGDELVERGLKPERVKVFPRGVDTELFNPAKRNGFFGKPVSEAPVRLLYVGRVSREKNLEQLARAFKVLSANEKNIELVIVGDGPYMEEMKKDLNGRPARFAGYLQGEDLASAFASCDIFVFPSTTDTFGNVVLEAQASGLPVIVSDKGGPRENLDHGVTGLIFHADDDEGLIEAMRRISTDPGLRKSMGKEARLYAERRSNEKAYELTWEMYTGLKTTQPLSANSDEDMFSKILTKTAV